jgi:subtilisin-like proprotein convertase family protein
MNVKKLSLSLLLLLLSSLVLLMATEPTPTFGQRPGEQDEVGPHQIFLPLVNQSTDNFPQEPNNDDQSEGGSRDETPSRMPAAGGITFALLGDYASNGPEPAQVADMIDVWFPDFVVTVGDNYYGSVGGAGGNGMNQFDNAVGTKYCRYLKDTGLPDVGTIDCPHSSQSQTVNRFFPSLGDHEFYDLQNSELDYVNYFNLPGVGIPTSNTSGNEYYYDFIQGPVHFFMLHSRAALSDANEMTAQQNWLQAQLAASTTPWQFVIIHNPPYSSGSVHGSHPALQREYAAWGADAIFSGDDHIYERILHDGIPYFVSGNGGTSLYNCTTPPVSGSESCYDQYEGAMSVIATPEYVLFKSFSLTDGAFGRNGGDVVDSYSLGNLATVKTSPAQLSDDAEESADGTMFRFSTDLELVEDTSSQTVGIRFPNVAVPQGSNIFDAYIEFTVDEASSEATSLVIAAQDVDNAPTFNGTAFNISSRTLTGERVNWNNLPAWLIDTEPTMLDFKPSTPNLSLMVQEVVNREGWSSGNAMAFTITGTGRRVVDSFESNSEGAQLVITFVSTDTNQAPNIINPGNQSDGEGDVVLLALSASDPDGDPLTYSTTGLPADLAINSNTGQISGTLAIGSAASYSVTVTVEDGNGGSDSANFTWIVNDPSGSIACTIYNSTDIPHALPNQTMAISSTMSISGSNTIVDINPTVDMTHSYVGDLSFILTHQDSNTSLTLIDRPGHPDTRWGCRNDDIVATLDDDASLGVENQCASSTPTISGTFTPTQSLDTFVGQNANGNWLLTVMDDYPTEDEGTLNNWSIEICTQGGAPTINNPGNQSHAEGDTISLTVSASDPDGDTLTFSASGLPTGLSINSSTGEISGTLPLGSANTYEVIVTVSDGIATDSSNFTWTVNDPRAGLSCTIYASSDIPQLLPNNSSAISSTVQITDTDTIVVLNASVDMAHTYVGDLSFTLTHQETGSSVTLMDRPGYPASTWGCSNNDILATFDDNSTTPIETECASSSPTINGIFNPTEPLSRFAGEVSNGTWLLTVSDGYPTEDQGTLNNWAVELCTQP